MQGIAKVMVWNLGKSIAELRKTMGNPRIGCDKYAVDD
jgi:hypothetical protein